MARPTKHKYRYKYVGRPTKLTEELVRKLEECASVRATIPETLYYVGIAESTYYKWLQENPQLSERIRDLKQKAFLVARQTIINHLSDTNVAFKFLEKEKPEDYAERLKVEHSGAIATDDIAVHPEDENLRLEYKNKLIQNIQRRAIERAKQKKQNETTQSPNATGEVRVNG